MSCLWTFSLAILHLMDFSKAYVYFIEQEKWPIEEFWNCRGTPNLQTQRVFMIEEASSAYYSTLMAGRFPEDRNLGLEVPPASILKEPLYLNVMDMVLKAQPNNFGNLLFMRMNCRLFNDLNWVRNIYNRALSRNTATVRAILDTIYRMALCIRNVDVHLNCPDACRGLSKDYCSKIPHTTGSCSTRLDELIGKSDVVYSNDTQTLTTNLRDWYRRVPIERRYPIEFFMRNSQNEELFRRKVEVQKIGARVAYCPCRVYYKYDVFLDGCVDISQDFGCGGGNPCANGGRCIPVMRVELDENGVSVEKPSFNCSCPPAFRGETCELETDRCAEENVCGDFQCLRDPTDLDNGYRCICPPNYKRKSSGEPQCVPLPACGETEKNLVGDGFYISNPSATQQPCLNKGQCVQDEKEPTMYTCICQPGYSGKDCEIEPPAAVWSPWSSWSKCIWPEPQEICYKRPYQEETRVCISYTPGQRCVGPQRRQRHTTCDVTSGSSMSYTGITHLKRERLRKAAELCDIAGKRIQPSINEEQLGEVLVSLDALDDYSSRGQESAPHLNLPQALRTGDLQAVNWPKSQDLLFMTLWIYAVLIHLGLIILWIYYIHRWRTTPFVPKRK
ncbi:Neurogenic locus notch protein [Fasciola hepatica]|uniref:Neurogenic locus notch protein n=1 Tax=Fasciola hepatica TaxID=6192 RepID=A0A4E0R0F5_FASHE|nr:Neurogenic locus notch protein [Fasciola hepatica]